MPNADARATFAIAQSHSAKLNDLQSQESDLVVMLQAAPLPNSVKLKEELTLVRKEWASTFEAYNAAMKLYDESVARSRKG